MNRFALTILFVAVAACRTATLFAQQPAALPTTPAQPAQPATVQPVMMLAQSNSDADTVREQLQDLMRRYPPQLGEVLRRDPSLLARPDYVAPYPMLVAFLQQHPEILRNPTYYFGSYDYYDRKRTPEERSLEALGVLLGGMAGFLAFTIVVGVLAWITKSVIQHRRWIRLSRVQTDVHTKLMDRMQTNEELLAYIQSPAGRRFLESTPPAEPDAPRWAAPVGPIIFSIMSGVVLATVGIGFIYSAWGITDDAKQAFIVAGVVVFSLGAGFILAALMAYVVSARLGLFPAAAPKPSTSLDNA